MTRNNNVHYAILALALVPACATGPDDGGAGADDTAAAAQRVTPAAPVSAAQSEATLRIPTVLRAECADLEKLAAPPADLTIAGFFACLSDDSVRSLDAAYRRRATRLAATGPADLRSFIAAYGDRRLTDGRLRDLAFGGPTTRDVQLEGLAPRTVAYSTGSSSSWGLDPTACTESCLSTSVPVVNGRRTIGHSPAWSGTTKAPGDGRRLLDDINPGKFPDFKQTDLANTELQASGCGPVSAVNLFEWWGIPVYKGSTLLTSFDARADYIADRMNTLTGINFTDDEDLIDFVTQYPVELYQAGRTSGYPARHYMVGDPSAWKVMLSYVGRGYPAIVLYASGSTSMHWAVITGYTNGKLRTANAGDRDLLDFYAQWHDWQALSWYASWAADLYVDPDTFVAYTGWGATSRPEPERMVARTFGSAPAGYTSGGSAYGFRYCVTAPDELGFEGEAEPVSFWPDEPASFLPGYCMFESRVPGFTLQPSPAGATGSRLGGWVSVSVAATTALGDFIAANPGVRCAFSGWNGSSWKVLADRRCGDAGALEYGFTNLGTTAKIAFQVHSAELAQTVWTVGTY